MVCQWAMPPKDLPPSSTVQRHVVVCTPGLMFGAVVYAADVQDRDGAPDKIGE